MNEGCRQCCPLGTTDDLLVFVTTGSNNKLPEEPNERQSSKVMYHVHLNMSVLYVCGSISARGTTDTSETSLTHVVWHAYCTARAFMCLKGTMQRRSVLFILVHYWVLQIPEFPNCNGAAWGPVWTGAAPRGEKGWNELLWRRFWVNFKQSQLASSIDFTNPEREQTTDKAARVQFKAMRSKFLFSAENTVQGLFFFVSLLVFFLCILTLATKSESPTTHHSWDAKVHKRNFFFLA